MVITPPPQGHAHASHPEERAMLRTTHHWHRPRVPLVVLRAEMPHPPMPPAQLARGALRASSRGLHGAPLHHPPRPRPLCQRQEQWGSSIIDEDWRLLMSWPLLQREG